MKEGWEYKKLGEVCSFKRGLTYSGKDEVEHSDNIVLRSNNVDLETFSLNFDELKYISEEIQIPTDKKLKKGTLLMCMSNGSKQHLGKVAYIDQDYPYAFGGFMGLLCPNDSVIFPKFLYFYCCSPTYKNFLSHIGNGANINNLKFSQLSDNLIPLPSIDQQQSIVSELDLINDLIAKKKAQLKDLDSLAQSLFYEMFGDPVENEKGWEVKKLGEVCYAQNGLVDPCVSPYDEMLHVGPANIVSHTGELVGLNKAKEENLISGKYLFRPGMLLYSKIRPNLNKVTIAHFEGICSADMYPLICNENVNEVYLLYILRSKCFLDYAIINSGRANIPKINRESLFAFKLLLPPLSLQQTFASRIEAIEEEKQKIQSSLKDLETLLASRMQYWFD